MKTANRTKPKTDFGIEVRVFTAQTGMTVKELAERVNKGEIAAEDYKRITGDDYDVA